MTLYGRIESLSGRLAPELRTAEVAVPEGPVQGRQGSVRFRV